MKKFKILIAFTLIMVTVFGFTFASTTEKNTESSDSLFELSITSLKNNAKSFNIKFLNDYSFTLGDSNKVPHIYSGASKYGFINSNIIETKKDFKAAIISIEKSIDANTGSVIAEARVSKDKKIWTEWRRADINNDNEVKFWDSYRYIQYRVSIISGSKDNAPIVRNISIKLKSVNPSDISMFSSKMFSDGVNTIGKPISQNLIAQENITVDTPYSTTCYATREGLVGGTTANGHTITSTDIFVALPSSSSLNSSDGDTTYTVNVTYNGNTYYNVPVWDIGPFNDRDDYWNPNYIETANGQERFRDNWGYSSYGDLSRGTAETYAAKNSNFHNGWTSSHTMFYLNAYHEDVYVSNTNPGTQVHNTLNNPLHSTTLRNNGAEIDLSDALFYGLGLQDNSTVVVTFNWVPYSFNY